MKNILATMAMAGLFTDTVLAHGGHGVTPGTSAAHYLVEPLHGLLMLAGLVMLGGLISRMLAARKFRSRVAFPGR